MWRCRHAGATVVASAVAGVPVGWLNPVHGFLIRCLFGDYFRFAGRNKGGITVVCADQDDHTELIFYNGSLTYSLTAGFDINARGAYRKIRTDCGFAIRGTSCRCRRWCQKVGESIIISGAGDSD